MNTADKIEHNKRNARPLQATCDDAPMARPVVTEIDRQRGFCELNVELNGGGIETVKVYSPEGQFSARTIFTIATPADASLRFQNALKCDHYFIGRLTADSQRMISEALALLAYGKFESKESHIPAYQSAESLTPYWKLTVNPQVVDVHCATGHHYLFHSQHISADGELSESMGRCPRGHCVLTAGKIILDGFTKDADGKVQITP